MPPNQNTMPPEFYLLLLSGRPGDVSHLSTERRYNDVGPHLSGHPFLKDPDRLMNLLDALAAICVHKETKEVYFVSLAMDPNAVTLHVSSNENVPATVATHLCKIRGQLKELRKVLDIPPIPPDSETSPDPNKTQLRADHEFQLQRTIYEYSYRKLRQRFVKRAPAILDRFETTTKKLQASPEDAELLHLTHWYLKHIQDLLRNDKPTNSLTDLIQTIDEMSRAWWNHLNAAGKEDILTQWDDLLWESGLTFCIYEAITHVLLLGADQNRKWSLRCLLEKLFTLHHHIHTITHIAWSHRLLPFLQGQFTVVSVPASCWDISLSFSPQNILPVIFPQGEQKELPVYDELLKRLKEKLDKEEITLKKGTNLSIKAAVHAECTLLVYHLQHPIPTPYHYLGGSKLSCHGCATLFSSFNLVAESFHSPQFFTKGCHNKIYLRWACPSLLSPEQTKQLQPGTPSLDAGVRKEMIVALSRELATYVNELRTFTEGSSRPQSDSTAASGDSREPPEAIARSQMRARVEAAFAYNV